MNSISVDFENLDWRDPWIYSVSGLEQELAREVPPGHPLYQVKAIAVGKRKDNDDVLFFLPDHDPPLAVVHLAWHYDHHPAWPHTEFFRSIPDFEDRRMKTDFHDILGQ